MYNQKKLLLFLTIMIIISLLVVGCDTEEVLPLQEEEVGEEAEEAVEQEAADQEQLFTLEELAAFDGQDGQPAYIVVDGIVYDVTNVRQWSMGSHFGFIAGTDVTDALASQAPHGANMLNQAEVVGKIAE